MKEIESIPNALRTFGALKNLGYNLNSSIADVVDNALTARVSATEVFVDLDFGTEDKIMCIIRDNGCGMGESELEEAMRIGADVEYGENDLGKFGMGMKTASLSQCNKLTVISKRKTLPLAGYCWDINRIKSGWKLLKLNNAEIKRCLAKNELDLGNRGTVVIWSDMEKVNQDYDSYANSSFAQNYFYRIVEQLKAHLSMTYHRFLDGSLGKNRTIKITVNGQLLSPWDPFCREEPDTQKITLKESLSDIKISGYDNPVHIEAYALPTKERFSSEAAWKEAKGPSSWNDSQGYYIYRANRLIRFGGWQGTKAKDEHDKLARVSIDIDPSLDDLFKTTVNKAKIEFPQVLSVKLKGAINPVVVKKAKAKYNKSEENLVVRNGFRKSEQDVTRISRDLLSENNITTTLSGNTSASNVEVQNPSGTWLSNKISEFLKYGSGKDYEILSDHLENGELWKLLCSEDDKFKVIVNADHPFYSRIYKSATNKASSNILDAFIFSLAFAELYNKNDQNAHLFNTFKAVCSQALARIAEEGII